MAKCECCGVREANNKHYCGSTPDTEGAPPAELYVPKQGERVRIVEMNPRWPNAKLRVGDVVVAGMGTQPGIEDRAGWLALWPTDGGAAICRVVPLTEPEPVPESDEKGCAKHGNINCSACCVIRRMATIAQERDRLRFKAALLAKECDELRSKVSELEGKYRAEVGANVDVLSRHRATLTATEAKLAAATEKAQWAEGQPTWYEERCQALADLKQAESVIDDRNGELARVRGELAEATQQVRTVINRDQSGLAAGLLHVKAIAQGYEWIPEGHWGSCDDTQQTIETLREETGNLIRAVVDGCMRYLRASGKRADEAAQFSLEAANETPAVAAPAEAQREIVVGQTWRGDCGEIDCTGKHVVTNVRMKSGRQSVSFACGDLRIGFTITCLWG